MVVFWSHTVSLCGEQLFSIANLSFLIFCQSIYCRFLLRCVHGILPPLPERYRKACQSLGVGECCVFLVWDLYHKTCFFHTMCVSEENRRVSRLCEVQGTAAPVWTSVDSVCLQRSDSSPPSAQAAGQPSTELRISANRLNNDLLPETDVCGGHYAQTEDLRHISQSDHWRGTQKSIGHVWNEESSCFPCKCTFIHPVI